MVKKYKYFYILIALFILSRLLFIFFTPYASFGEERRIGTIGHDLVFEKGLRIPFWAYLDSAHSGGSIFSGLAAVPFYIIFGDRYLALKITALFFSLLTVLLWYRLLFPEIKKSSFFFPLFLLFFSFSIPNYLEKSVLLMGNANEIIFFNALVISYFWKINNNLKPKALDYLLLGIVSGFSFWVQFMNSYLFLAIIIALLVTKRFTQALKYIFLLFAGFLLGAFPLWVYNFLYQWITLVVDTGGISFSFLNLEKLKNLLLTDLPASFHFLDLGPIKSQYLSYFVYGLFASGLFLHVFINLFRLVKQKKRELSLEIFLIIYFTVFILATCFSSAPIRCIGYYGFNSMETLAEYYIVSLQPIMLIIFLLLLKYRSNFFIWINLSVSIVFILGYVNLFSCPYYNEELFRPHCNLHGNVYECGFNYVRHPELFLRFRQKLPPELRDEYMQGAWEFFSLGSDRQKELLEKAKTFDVDGVYREFEK